MAYVTVYSPEGKKFEVASRDRADKLILEEGWTQTPPKTKEAPKRSTRKKKEAPVEDFEQEEPKAQPWFSDDAEESGV